MANSRIHTCKKLIKQCWTYWTQSLKIMDFDSGTESAQTFNHILLYRALAVQTLLVLDGFLYIADLRKKEPWNFRDDFAYNKKF